MENCIFMLLDRQYRASIPLSHKVSSVWLTDMMNGLAGLLDIALRYTVVFREFRLTTSLEHPILAAVFV